MNSFLSRYSLFIRRDVRERDRILYKALLLFCVFLNLALLYIHHTANIQAGGDWGSITSKGEEGKDK